MTLEEKIERAKKLDEIQNNWPQDKKKKVAQTIMSSARTGLVYNKDISDEELKDVSDAIEAFELSIELDD